MNAQPPLRHDSDRASCRSKAWLGTTPTYPALRVGVVGLDGMGGAVARRLAASRFPVTGHHPPRLQADDLVALDDAGIRVTTLPAEAAEPADVVIVDLANDVDREEALFDHGGVGE